MTAPHPGDVFAKHIKDTGFTQTDFGKRNKAIHWVTVNRLVKGHERIGPQQALILGKLFSTTPEYWMHLQADWDLQQHREKLAKGAKPMHVKQAAIIERTKVFG